MAFFRIRSQVIVQGGAGCLEEPSERLPVFEHVFEGGPQSGVGFDEFAVHPALHPVVEFRHDGAAVGFMEFQSRLRG